ncbi:hypothetical protein DPMN_127364, partial [Dreissena polymorpha]
MSFKSSPERILHDSRRKTIEKRFEKLIPEAEDKCPYSEGEGGSAKYESRKNCRIGQ